MRWQVFVGFLTVGLAMAAPASAGLIDFSTDPQLATNWTSTLMYTEGSTGDATTAVWNSVNQDLDLASTGENVLKLLTPTGYIRSDTDMATMTIKDPVLPNGAWAEVELTLSSVSAPSLFDGNPVYRFIEWAETSGTYYLIKGANNASLFYTATAFPSTAKLDIVRDGADYVFKVNDTELFRDATYASTPLPYCFMGWGASAGQSISARVDDFVPEPGSMILVATGAIGLLAYAWRKRK